MVTGLLTVADIWTEDFEARTQLLESRGKGSSKKKQDGREVNMTDRGDHRDHGYHSKQSSKQKEKRMFKHPHDAEK
jgi:hypothetical protein